MLLGNARLNILRESISNEVQDATTNSEIGLRREEKVELSERSNQKIQDAVGQPS